MNVRNARVEDAAAVADVMRAFDREHAGATESDEAEVLDWWRDADLDRAVWVAEVDGRIVAHASVEERRGGGAAGDVVVHPAFAARGIGSRLTELVEQRARELANASGSLQFAAFASDAAAGELLVRRGYRVVRRYIRMVIDLEDEPPAPADVPGVTVRPFAEGDAAAVHAAVHEAFAEEWNFAPVPYEEWVEKRLGRSDPALWRVASEGDDVAGATLCDPRRFGGGWIGAVAVRPSWRRRGIGYALLIESLRGLHERGERRVALTVDTENPTGATRLYERAGMRELFRATMYERELS